MTRHVLEQLPEFVLGGLSDIERAGVAQHLPSCPACTSELAALANAVAAITLAPHPVPAPPALRERLLTGLAPGARFEPLAPRVAELFDLDEARTRALLGRLDDPLFWAPGPIPGVAMARVTAGPRVRGVRGEACFLRTAPGVHFPRHRHSGEERVLVMQGGYHDEDGTDVRRGDLAVGAPGTSHGFVVPDEPDAVPCLAAIVSLGWEVVGP